MGHMKMRSVRWKIIAVVFLLCQGSVVRAQLPSFLSALYGGGVTSTPKPFIRPRPRLDRQSVDDAYSGPTAKPINSLNSNGNQIITVPPPKVPVSNPLLNTYTVNNNGPNLQTFGQNNIGPSLQTNSVGPSLGSSAPINVPSSFANSPSVRFCSYFFL